MLIALPYSLTAHSTAKASEVMANLNKILEAINGGLDQENFAGKMQPLLVAGEKTPSGLIATGTFEDIPGMALTVAPTVKSLLVATLSMKQTGGTLPQEKVEGWITVDGAEYGHKIKIQREEGGTFWTDTASETIGATLEPGSHTIKARGFRNNFSNFSARLVYILVPTA